MSELHDNPDEQALKRGQVVIRPGPHDVFVDIDDEAHYAQLIDILGLIERNGNAVTVEMVTPSKSGGEKRHVYLRCDRPLEVIERIALQACLGSDPRREILSLLRAWSPHSDTNRAPTVFFESPDHPKAPKSSSFLRKQRALPV
jgi:hypothetical protein